LNVLNFVPIVTGADIDKNPYNLLNVVWSIGIVAIKEKATNQIIILC